MDVAQSPSLTASQTETGVSIRNGIFRKKVLRGDRSRTGRHLRGLGDDEKTSVKARGNAGRGHASLRASQEAKQPPLPKSPRPRPRPGNGTQEPDELVKDAHLPTVDETPIRVPPITTRLW